MKPVAIDLFCGLGGWTKGFLAEGYEVIGFDIEHKSSYPGHYIEMDVAKLSGYDLRAVNPTVIVASPPCQAYSYRAMPWKRAKALPPPSNELFDACFRIAREAGCPLVVENVKGAQPWVGRAQWHYGSFYLWGDVPALMPSNRHLKNTGGSWFGERDGKALERNDPRDMRKNEAGEFTAMGRKGGHNHPGKILDGLKRPGIDLCKDGMNNYPKDADGLRTAPDGSRHDSRASARKAASAAIAEIPYDLANWIARCFRP